VVIDPETGDVIVAGNFAAIGEGAEAVDANNVARWDGTRWHAYGGGIGGLFGSVLSLAFFEGDLVAVGGFDLAGSPMPAARWDGTAWVALASTGPDAISLAAAEPVGGGLFVGGVFDVDGEPAHVAYFDGTAWSPLRGGGTSDLVEALVTTEEGLYVGGTFDRAGTVASVGVALFGYED
jgi:hypothetical protein